MVSTKPKQPECSNYFMLFTGIKIEFSCFFFRSSFAQHMVNIYQSLNFVCHVSTVLYSKYVKRSLRRLSSNEARADSNEKKNVLSLLNDIHANWLQHLGRFFPQRTTTTTNPNRIHTICWRIREKWIFSHPSISIDVDDVVCVDAPYQHRFARVFNWM